MALMIRHTIFFVVRLSTQLWGADMNPSETTHWFPADAFGPRTLESPYGWGLPLNISAHAGAMDQLIVIVHWFSIVLFAGWGIYFLYCLVKFRARPGIQPDISHHHFKFPTVLEIGVAVFEVCLLVFLAVPLWAQVKDDFPNESEALVVRVVAEQFAWNIHYPGRDGKFGKTSIDLMDGTNPIGLDRSDPDAKDDIFTINNFHVPINKKVIVNLSSKDVIHSFFLPVVRVKLDVVPGLKNRVWFEANQTGTFEIACAQLCGNSHFRMRGQFFVDTPEAYAAFMAEEEKALAEASQ